MDDGAADTRGIAAELPGGDDVPCHEQRAADRDSAVRGIHIQAGAGNAGMEPGRAMQIRIGIDRDGAGLDVGLRIDRQPRGGPAVVHRLLIVVADIDVDLTATLGFRGQIRGDRRLPRYADAGRALDIGIGIGQGRAVGAKVDGIGVHRKAIGNRDLPAIGLGHEIGDGTDIVAGAGAGIEQGVRCRHGQG